jgi:hypothetical protein
LENIILYIYIYTYINRKKENIFTYTCVYVWRVGCSRTVASQDRKIWLPGTPGTLARRPGVSGHLEC